MTVEKGGADASNEKGQTVDVVLSAFAEQSLIGRAGSSRCVYFNLKVGETPPARTAQRAPLTLALVLDRSGSMSGEKLVTAKRAAVAVMERLNERDRLAVVVFDDKIDVLQPAMAATDEIKAHVRAALTRIEARSNTALHEGWLTACQSIAADSLPNSALNLSRCFLLTDGQANVGVTDPEQIASDAAGIREKAGIGTSTFGVGSDYNEALLGPLAVAGGGQFHHLRTVADIADTFLGEIDDLLAVAARNVRVELEVEPGSSVELVSAYWTRAIPAEGQRFSIAVGDLLGGEERHVVASIGFRPFSGQDGSAVRARVVWQAGGEEREGEWQELRFSYGDDNAVADETKNPVVTNWLSIHLAERAKIEATQLSKHGDTAGARNRLRQVVDRVTPYASSNPGVRDKVEELQAMEREIAEAPLDAMRAKEIHFQSQRLSRGQKDFRRPGPASGGPQGPGAGLPHIGEAAEMVSRYLLNKVDWPGTLPQGLSTEALRDLYRGCLLWGAVGDALGRAGEGLDPATIRARFGRQGIQRYVPWPGWRGGPKGTITDDTQLTMEVARTLLASPEEFDANDFARRLIVWLPVGRGKGLSTTRAVEALIEGKPWWIAGLHVNSAGNGAAMRAAPVGLARALCATPGKLRRDAVLSAFPTHTHPVGVAGAVAIAAGVAWCIRESFKQTRQLEPRAFVEFVVRTIAGTEPYATMERRPGGRAVRLSERIGEIPDLLRLAPEEAFSYLWNGAFALESVPAALYCFLRTPDDPHRTINTAANAGHDSDSLAALAGNLAGAWNGAGRLCREEPEWWTELEYRDELVALADGLLEIALRHR